MGTTPILIDLGGGLRLSSPEAGVQFDMTGAGTTKRWSWPTGGDGWLVWDRDGNGVIDSGRELFGNATLMPDGTRARNGFLALGALDSNGDGLINGDDTHFQDLRVWADLDRDGVSTPAELKSLGQVDIVALSVDEKLSRRRDRWGNLYRWRAPVTHRDGTRRFAYDVTLAAPGYSARPRTCKPADSEVRWPEPNEHRQVSKLR